MQVIPVHGSKTNIVTKVEWFVKAVDKENNVSASTSGIRNFSLGDTFTPFENLTEEQVLNWCFAPQLVTQTDSKSNVNSTIKHLKVDIEAQVTKQIAEQIERKLIKIVTEPALPWVTI
jgi:hypothetical protein